MSPRKILVTGAGGYLGARTAKRLLETSDDEVVLWIHAGSIEEARTKAAPIARLLSAFEGRIAFSHGELAAAEPFASVDPRAIGAIVHAAAVTRFNVEASVADEVNLGGAEKAFAFAERCPSLDHLTYVSTAYVAGLRTGAIAEALSVDAPPFANHYERSKWESERALAERHASLPWRIARVATVISDDERGGVTQYNAVHNTLKLFYYGLVSLVPGLGDTPLYFVTGDFVAEALAAIVRGSEPRAVYLVAHARSESLTLDELISLAFEAFETSESFRSRRVLKPLYVNAESFEALVDGIEGFGGDVVKQALRSVAPFARQLFASKDFANARLRTVMPDYHAPDPRALARAVCGALVRTRWGKDAP
jgi:nucleoside-diphosphate-sugar epimerase